MKKIIILIIILALAFLAYLMVILLPRNYQLTYQINGYEVNEIYHKDLGYYEFAVHFEGRDYPLVIVMPYSSKRGLIKKVEKKISNDITCLSVTTNEEVWPVCYQADQLVDYRLTDQTMLNNYADLTKDYSNAVIDSYEGLKIYNYLDNNYYIWNYKGYYLLNKAGNQVINIISSDDYNNALAYQINEYLITPNYDSKHLFTEFLVINTNSKEISSFELETEIAYNAYYLGDSGKEVYLVDKKNKIEYAFNIKKATTRIIGDENKDGLWYDHGWQKISLNKLVNQEYQFKQKQIHNYEVVDGQLYYLINETRILVSKEKIKAIVWQKEDVIYYIADNLLYSYSKATGEVKIVENNEWDFNFNNKVFIFD